MKAQQNTPKIRRKLTIIRVLLFICIGFQLLGYIGQTKSHAPLNNSNGEAIGYYIGYNFFLWIAIGLFLWMWKVQKQLKKASGAHLIDS